MKLEKNMFRPGEVRLRATFAAGDLDASQRFGSVDEKTGKLTSVQICLEGEARGHGAYLAEDFMDALVAQGNSFKKGCKTRFGHPAMCSDALGTFLGYATNFSKRPVTRKDGTKCSGVFADIQLADEAKHAPGGDLYTWTLMTAKNNPESFGQSIVFTYADFYVLDKDGQKLLYSEAKHTDDWYDSSVDGKIYAVLDKLIGSDFTDSPAATDGVFSSASLAAQATQMLDDNPQILAMLTNQPETVNQFLDRYNASLAAAGKPTISLRVSGEIDPALGAAHAEIETFRKKLDEAEGRFKGLQSAKDAQLSQKATEFAAKEENFKSQLSTLQKGLDDAQAALSASKGELDKVTTALAEKDKQLSAKETALAKLTGGTLGGSGDGKATDGLTGLARMNAASAREQAQK